MQPSILREQRLTRRNRTRNHKGQIVDEKQPCPMCYGSGFIVIAPPVFPYFCPLCNGTGYSKKPSSPARQSDFTPWPEVFESDVDPRTSE